MSIERSFEQKSEQKPETTRGQRWTVPVTALVAGVGYIAIFLYRHEPGMAAFGFLIMVAYAAILVMTSRRSEAVALLRGETTDERRNEISKRASVFTLHVLVVVLLGGGLVELIRGHDAQPWALLCAIGGVSYIVGIVVFSRRG